MTTNLIPLTSGDLVDHLRSLGLTNDSLLMDIEDAIYRYIKAGRWLAIDSDAMVHQRAQLLAARVDGNL
jgi:hypothetical protein